MPANSHPNLFLIGAPRSGTSFLFSALGQHPEIFAPPVKEPHFHLADRWPLGGPEAKAFTTPLAEFLAGKRKSVWGGMMTQPADYESLYAPGGEYPWRLEGTPNYLAEGQRLAKRIAEGSPPDTRVIAAVREPVARALSHYQLFLQNGWETLNFEDALAATDDRLSKGWAPTWDYLRYSQYDGPVSEWRAVFGDRFRLVSFDDLIWNPQSVFADLVAWLGLNQATLGPGTALNPSTALNDLDLPTAEASIRATGRLNVDQETASYQAAHSPKHAAPLVCVGMPVHNGAATIAKALRSLQSQSYPNLRMTVCDNASTDGTDRIVADMARADPRITLKRFDTLVDIRGSYARALETADGDYFMFAPSDDTWTPGFISAAVGRMQADTNISVCCGQIEVFDDVGATAFSAGVHKVRGSSAKRWQKALAQSADASRLYGLIRQSALLRLFPVTAPEGWDHYSAAKLALRGSVAALDTVAMHRHKTPRLDYQANVFAQEATFWGRVFYARHVTRLFREDPDFNTQTLGAQAALLGHTLNQSALPLMQKRKKWLRKIFRRAGKLCVVISSAATPK